MKTLNQFAGIAKVFAVSFLLITIQFSVQAKGGNTDAQAIPAETDSNTAIFPNPSPSGIWTLQTGAEWAGSRVEVSNTDGTIVYRNTIHSTTLQIGTTDLVPGIYVVNIRNAEKMSSQWLVKL